MSLFLNLVKKILSPSLLRARKRENYRKGNKGKTRRNYIRMKQRRFRTIILQGPIEKSPIFLSQYLENE